MPDHICPDRRRLESLLAGTLPEAEQGPVAAHLEGCAACQKTLEGLAGQSCGRPRPPPGRTAGAARTGAGEGDGRGAGRRQHPDAGGGHGRRTRRRARRSSPRPAGPTRSAGSGTTRCWRCSARAGSASSSGRSTTCCSGWSRSRCWPRRWPPPRRPASGSCARPGRRPQVRHENVVQVYEVEEQPLPYLVMEFIPGETLQQRLDRDRPARRGRGAADRPADRRGAGRRPRAAA